MASSPEFRPPNHFSDKEASLAPVEKPTYLIPVFTNEYINSGDTNEVLMLPYDEVRLLHQITTTQDTEFALIDADLDERNST